MLRKYLIVGLLIGQVVLIAVLISVFLQRPDAASASNVSAPSSSPADAPQAQATVAGLYMWSYAAKFVCGYQQAAQPGAIITGETTLKPGNYATVINIHNPIYKQVPLRKKFIVEMVGSQPFAMEPQQTEPRNVVTMTLGPDMVTMDDCNNLWKYSFPAAPPTGQMPVFIGYLVILSPVDLDVDAAYTANAPGDLHIAPTGVSIDVERVTGKRVFLPAGILP
jgi:hypothetical protein